MKNRFLKYSYGLKFSYYFFFNNLCLLIFSNNILFYLSRINKLKFIYCKKYQFFFNLKKFFNLFSLSNLTSYLKNLLYTSPFMIILFFNVEIQNLIILIRNFQYFFLKRVIYFLGALYENYLIYSSLFFNFLNYIDLNLFFFVKYFLFKAIKIYSLSAKIA